MPWFESSKDKQFRELVQSRMEICLAKPDKYEEAKTFLASLVTKPNQKAIEMIVDHIKEVIKDDDVEPVRKLRAMTLLRDLMETQSKALGKYVVKKILKRLTIFAEHRKNEKDQNRGANIFKCKRSQQKYGIQFLKTLLLAIQQWGKNWPRQVDGPFHDFQAAYNDLLMQKQVTFPIDNRKANKSVSPSPFGKNNRSSRQQFNSPPKITAQPGMRGTLQNPLSKPVIKQRTLLTGQAASYINQMIEMLNLLSITLSQNQEFGEIWAVIKPCVDQFKVIQQTGELIMDRMKQKGQQNQQLFQAIVSNKQFIDLLEKETDIVDRKNQNYGRYNSKYSKKCKKIALSLSVFIEQPGSSQSNPNNLSAGNNKPANENSINQKVQQVRGLQKPKAMEEGNRYGSSAALRNQLQINLMPVNKEDFNSNTHKFNENSQGSSRYNSVSGNIPADRNRNSQNQFNVSSQFKEKQLPRQQNKIGSPSKGKQQKKTVPQDVNKNSKNLKQISKITEKNQNQSENNINKFDFDNQKPENDKNNINGSFGDFQVSGEKQHKQDSNSNFFKQLDMKEEGIMQAGVRKGRKPPNKIKPPQDENFFEVSIKSKQQSQNISEFNKSKSNSKQAQKKQGNQNQEPSKPGFDTFKNPNQLSNAIQQLKKSTKSQKSDTLNPFASKPHDFHNSFDKSQEFAENPFSSKIPDTKLDNSNQFQSNAQRKDTYQNDQDNPFSTKIQKKPNYQSENPFASKIEDFGIGVFTNKQKDDSDNKSKSSNPFSSKNDPSNKSFDKSSIKSKPPMQKKQSQLSNPFDQRSQKSQKSQNSHKFDNPFENQLNNEKSLPIDLNNKKMPSEKSLSQRGSFVDTKNIEKISARNVDSMDDPFQHQSSRQNSRKIKDNSLKNDKANEVVINQSFTGQKEKSFQGFNFEDFMNASQQKSQASSVKQTKKNQIQNKQNQLELNFSDFADVNNEQKKSNSSDFFNKQKNAEENNSNKNERIFDFFQSNNTKQQPQPQRDFFQTTNKSFNKQQQIKKQQQNSKLGKNSFGQNQFGFQDFENISKKSQQKSSKNPFSSFQQSKNFVQPINAFPKLDSKDGSQRSSDEWNKFDNIQEKKDKFELNGKQNNQQSRYQPSDQNEEELNRRRADTPWFNQFKRKKTQQSKDLFRSSEKKFINDKQPQFGNQQKSISIHFDEPSPFQKKQIPWDYTLAALYSSTRYNVADTDINQKKLMLLDLQNSYQSRLNRFKQLNQKLNSLKKTYSGCIERVGQAREQKKQFLIILKRLEQANEVKQKQIEDLIKKTKKIQQLKRKILENERVLYERMRDQKRSRETDAIYKGKTGNKWDRFNQNLKRQRQQVYSQKTVSNYSYYA